MSQKKVTVTANETSEWIEYQAWLAPKVTVNGVFDNAGIQIEFSPDEGTTVYKLITYWFLDNDWEDLFTHGSRVSGSWYFRAVVLGGNGQTSITVEV